MSLVLSDTVTRKGLVQFYEKECGYKYGDVSGNTDRFLEFVAAVNVALDDFIAMALLSSGTWQFDDSNHSDYPIITANLVSGQRDYPFTVDGSGNLILEIFKVFIADTGGIFTEALPVDVETGASYPRTGAVSGMIDPSSLDSFTNGQNASGKPFRYDKLANGIFLDPIPNYDLANGLKMYVSREGYYATTSNLSWKPGVPGLFHKYFYLKPAREYARQNDLDSFVKLDAEVTKLEGNPDLGVMGLIPAYFSSRMKDERPRLIVGMDSNK